MTTRKWFAKQNRLYPCVRCGNYYRFGDMHETQKDDDAPIEIFCSDCIEKATKELSKK